MNKILDKIKALETNDYQNRGGSYPKSDKPDTITCYEPNMLTLSFKNTSEESALKFVK